MSTAKTRTFKSGNSEAVRIPKDMAFGEGVELVIVRSGDTITLYPAEKRRLSLEEMFDALNKLPAPGEIQERDKIEFPERDGL